jgi:hypothetical protein
LLPYSSSNRVSGRDGGKGSLGEGKESEGSRKLIHSDENEWKER